MTEGNTSRPASAEARSGRPEDGGTALKFGCVIFDDEKNPGAGWVSVGGGPARRVNGVNQLPTDAIYWSNITYESFRSTGIDRNPWIRHDAYLVTKPKDVLLEWGQDPATTPPDYMATFCSTMFGRVLTLAHHLAAECDPGIKPATLFGGDTLRADFRRLLPPLDYPKGESAAVIKQGHAFAEFTRTSVRGVKGSRLFMLRRPRLPYAIEMLTTPVPSGKFEFRSRRELRALGADDPASWVGSTEHPCMVEVVIDEMQQDVAPIYGFGNSTDKDRRIPRSWVAHPEFILMRTFSAMDVRNAYVASGYTQLNLALPEPIRRFLSDLHGEASWSAGIIAETIWRAACMAPPRERGQPIGSERAGTSWQGAWLRAADKVCGFLSAMRLTDLGYPVASYGYGWIQVSITDDQIPDLIRDGLSIGLFPRLFDVPGDLFGAAENINWGGDKKSRIMAQLTVTQQKHLLWNLDRLPLYDKNQRDSALKKMLDAHRNAKLGR